ncbi:MAG: hypothetical protein KDE47_30485 [Caldilineaceae bacterium]|nr:hypothetical protein [Caldilineaceae bacterium]MCB9151403.1 hypothetical protein [Caldilineaceae bacterium]
MGKRRVVSAKYLVILATVVCLSILGLDRLADVPTVRFAANQLLAWTLLLAAFGLLAGIFNLLYIHAQRIWRGRPEWSMSLVLIGVALAVFSVGMVESSGAFGPLMQWVFHNILTPVPAALFALLAFFLAAAAYRFLRIGRHGSSWMLAGALLMMLTQMPLLRGLLPDAAYATMHWLIDKPVMAAMRGVLLGMSLAMLMVGVHLVFKE